MIAKCGFLIADLLVHHLAIRNRQSEIERDV